MSTKAPKHIFLETVKHFPMVSINIVIQNSSNEVLYVMRANQPAKGHWWVPGGRLLNGESFAQAARRIVKEEVGIDSDESITICPEYFEEFFDTSNYSQEDIEYYSPDITCIHYVSTVAYMRIDSDQEQQIELDLQSSDYKWSQENLSNHPIQDVYFTALRNMNIDV